MMTFALNASVCVAYAFLATYLISLVTQVVSRAAVAVGIKDTDGFEKKFRFFAILFFLGCSYSHAEIAIHALLDDLPEDYSNITHYIPMALQNIGAWGFNVMLFKLDRKARRLVS